jgi:ABC-2 type transport system permease protein
VYGAAIAGSEWTWGTLKSAVARGEARSWYLLATFIAIVLVIGVALIVSYLIGVGAAYVGAGLAQVPTDGLDDRSTLGELPAQLARSWVVLSEQAAIGYAVATVARSQLAGIGVGIAAYFGEGFASLFISDVTKWLPFSAAGAALPAVGQGNGQIVSNLSADTALLVVAAWLVGALVVAALFTERAEIGG